MPDLNSPSTGGITPRPVPRVPDHELIRRIGEGAYGEVWLARNVVGTPRAVKVVYRDTFADDHPYEREYRGIRTFEPVSRSNDGFVDILQIGRNDEAGYFYYVMELADDVRAAAPPPGAGSPEHGPGDPSPSARWTPETYAPKTLREEILKRGRLPVDECLTLAMSLTLALGHLHRQGLIHRDIKPSNIIVVGGIPKFADIGLVAEVDEARSFVGTEGFVAPEGPNTQQADLYALGKVLYEMSMGKDRLDFPEPFTALGQPTAPAQLDELNLVIVRACAPLPADRYRTAGEMHLDLALLHSGRSVKARRSLDRRLRVARRAAAFVAAVALLASGAFLYQRHQTREARRLQRIAEDLNARLQIRDAESRFAEGNAALALAQLARVLREHPDHRIAAERLLAALMQRSFPRLLLPPLVQDSKAPLPPHLGPANRRPARFSPEGRRVLTVGGDHSVGVRDLATGAEAFPRTRHEGEVHAAEFSPDGRTLVSASEDRTARVIDASTGRPVFPALRHDQAVLQAAWVPDGRGIATASADGTARIFDARTGALTHGPFTNSGPVNALALRPDGRRLATATREGRVSLWDLDRSVELHCIQLEGPAQNLRFSPDGRWLAATVFAEHAHGLWRVQVWDAESGTPATGPLDHRNRIYSLEFSPDSRRLVTATYDDVARVWETATGRELFQLRHASPVSSASFHPGGGRILTSSLDQTARLWDASDGTPLSEAMRHDGRVLHAEFSPDGTRVLTAGWEDMAVKIWDTRTSPPPPLTLPHPHWVMTGEFDPAGRGILTASGGAVRTAVFDNRFGNDPAFVGTWDPATGAPGTALTPQDGLEPVTARFTKAGPLALLSERKDDDEFSRRAQVWELRTGTPVGAALQHPEEITCAQFSADGRRLATASEDGILLLWDACPGAPLTPPLQHPGRPRALHFSPDATLLLSVADRGSAILWDVATGRPVGAPLHHADRIWFAQFGPRGDRVVTCSLDNSAKIWSTRGTLLVSLRHTAPVEAAEFSPDGARLATVSGSTVRLWEVPTGMQLAEVLHEKPILGARFSGDGLRFITATKGGIAQVWDAETCLRLGDPFRHGDWVTSARFSPEGDRALTVSLDRTAKVWRVPVAPDPLPDWLPALAEVIGGTRLNADRIPEPVSWPQRAELSARLSSLPDAAPLVSWARSLLAPPADAPGLVTPK